MSKTKRLHFYGNETNTPFVSDTQTNKYLDTQTRVAFEVVSQRSHTFKKAIEIDDDEIVEMEFDNGFVRMLTPAQLAEEFPSVQKRGVDEEIKPDEILLPTYIEGEEHSRGFMKNILKKFRIIRVHDTLVDLTAKEIARKIEDKLEPSEGLYYCSDPNQLGKPVVKIDIEKPLLILLHGTASNTQGSFGGFVQNESSSEAWFALEQKYKGRILAFEHKTLSKSPLQNAFHLLNTLPEKATLHLISHSRGGLVGEILSRSLIDNQKAFSEIDLKVFESENRKEDLETAKKINQLFEEKKIKVTKFVRVACPASGTTLASKRLDQYFTVLLNLFGMIPALRLSPIYGYIKSFLIAFVKKKADINVMPGLESMMPSSPLIRVLNNAGRQISSELFVISGDVKAHGIGHSLAVLLTDVFYRTQHDFVVNTSSMFGGCKRDQMYYTFSNNKDTSHFNYFVNKTSQDHIAQALTEDKIQSTSFKLLDVSLLEEFELSKVRGVLDYVDPTKTFDNNQPFVYVVPGIMGSKLKAKGKRVWVNPFSLAFGGIENLQINDPDVEPFQLMGSAYKSLLKALRKKYNVIPFPYDWRISITDAANRLAKDLKQRMETTTQPIRLMGHSMGGLVIHALYSMPEHKEVWEQLVSRPGSRVIFLGSPLRGSHVIPSVFMKKDKFFKILHYMDLTNNSKEILEIIKDYPGLLELLPMEGSHDYFNMMVWEQLAKSEGDFVKPLKSALQKASNLQKLFKKRPIEGDNIIYVAGKDRHTPCKLEFKKSKATLLGTSQGDGRVTYETGIPKNLLDRTWYMNATHGKLCASKDDFPALFDLLETGFTQLLPNKPIFHRGENSKLFEMPEETTLAVHTEIALEHAIMGLDPNLKFDEPEINVMIEICHGDLGNARYPLAVGHHYGDPIVSAEGVVDHYMENRLAKNRALGVYPGYLETSLVLLNEPDARFKGAIVVGLGVYGALNEGKLTRSFSRALLDYAIATTDPTCQSNIKSKEQQVLGVSSLLVGSDYSGLSIRNSMRAMLNGILQANKILQSMNDVDVPIIGNIEFIEIYKDRAIQATHDLIKIIKEPIFSEKVIFEDRFVKEVSGRRRRIPGEKSSSWWHRLQIEGKGTNDEHPPLKFVSLTDRARAEEEIKPTQRKLIDNLIASSVQSNDWNEENARTLFHLLIPNDFKDYATDNINMLLILDEKSAYYPWEILHLPNAKFNDPLVTQIGLIRQLVTNEYDQIVNSTLENSVLIVGNPNTEPIEKYPPLPHAEEEATAVAEIFENNSFKTVLSVKDSGVSVVNKLFSNNYKIIHLAGHGIIEENDRSRTGMVLDKDMFITAAEIDALPKTPELVFINCCYLGKNVTSATAFHKLAANVGTQFIRKGVKAVVAAGWAIDDAAAKHFAVELYNKLFKGETFGEAVRQARLSTYRNYSSSNTWGAYQCYGDPYYKLVRDKKSYHHKEIIYVDALEVIVELENITSQAEPASSRDRNDLKLKLHGIIKQIPSKWLQDSKVVEAIADCFYELNLYEEALKYYKKLSYSIDGQTTLEGMLRMANIQTKVAVKKIKQTSLSATEEKEARSWIQNSEEIIDNILSIGENSRRYAIKGGHFKRKSILKNEHLSAQKQFEFIKDCLELSLEAYAKASKFITNEMMDYYAIINWSTMEIIYQLYGGQRTVSMKQASEKIDWLRGNFCGDSEERSFWYHIFPAALGIYDLLLLSPNQQDEQKEIIENVINKYESNWSKGGSVRKSENIIGQLDFLITILTKRLDFKITKATKNKVEFTITTLKKLRPKLDEVFSN